MATHSYGQRYKREFSHSYLREVPLPGRFGLRAYPAYETGSQVHKQGKTHDGINDFENQLLQVPQNKEARSHKEKSWEISMEMVDNCRISGGIGGELPRDIPDVLYV